MNDEAVQLKLLQTALSFMQSNLLAQSEVCCFPGEQSITLKQQTVHRAVHIAGRDCHGPWHMFQASGKRKKQKL